ncbi:MAG: four helix bundle protein [Nostoc sp.]|uniref:four helix bundle protein n=1 Tax=unclassified Nostoc TaxID=2593658 RepID=UPI0025DC6C84|nr:four helix bundle protein [Nostoc sp. NMS9]
MVSATIATAPLGKSKVKSQKSKIIIEFWYTLALKEAKETKYWLKLLIKSEMMSEAQVRNILDECEQLIKIIAKSIVTTKANLGK